jgi:hypothetical protein
VLGERIERNLYDLLETPLKSKYTRNRQELLQRANLTLEILRFQMRLAEDLQCLKVESYGFAARAIDEIGKLVVGWPKAGESKPSSGTSTRGRARSPFPTCSAPPARRSAASASVLTWPCSTSTGNARCGPCTRS